MPELTFLIDSGHGGLIHDVYQTAPKKMYRHENGEIAYEGVINRIIGDLVIKEMKRRQLRVIDIVPTEIDLDLDTRCNIINQYCGDFGNSNCLVISLHMNAGKGTGFEIWTSPGATKSDKYASIFAEFYMDAFPDEHIRKDESDGDIDKESAFYILVNSKCPAILPEWLFYDNPKDWEIQKNPDMQHKYATMITDFAQNIMFNPF